MVLGLSNNSIYSARVDAPISGDLDPSVGVGKRR